MSDYIPEGAILLARVTMNSDIWEKKPSWWLKVWTYILMKVNHKGNKMFNRGSNFFNRNWIYDDCKLVNDRIKADSIDNVIRWLRDEKMITTQKTTRGIIINVCNYETYQDLASYRNDTANETETRQKRDRNETINNNEIYGNNDNTLFSPENNNGDTPEPPVKPKKKRNTEVDKPKKPKERKRDEMFDAISEIFNISPKGSGGSRIGRLKRLFVDHGATPDEIKKRVRVYKELHPTWDLTAEAVEKHWGSLQGNNGSDELSDDPYDSMDYDQQMEYFRPMYGWDWKADDSHEPIWEKLAASYGATKYDYGKWRRDYSLKNGPYSKENPLPRCEYPKLEPEKIKGKG